MHDDTDELPFSSMQELLEHIQELKQSLEHTELLLAKANTDKDNFFKMYIEAQFGIKNKKANTNDSSNNIDKTESKV